MKHVAYILLVQYASVLYNNISFRKKTKQKKNLALCGGRYVSTVFTDIISYEKNYKVGYE